MCVPPDTSAGEARARCHTARTPASTTRKDSASENFTVELELPDGEVCSLEVGAEEYILDAAHRAGLDLPIVCEQGWDLACAVKVLSGTLDHSDARRYYEKDHEAGFALICTGKPRSDLRLFTYQSEALREHRDAHNLPAPRGT